MTSGTIAAVDKKGRLLIPKTLRDLIGIEEDVLLAPEKDILMVRPLKKIKDPLEFLTSIQFKTRLTPVQMKREAEQVLWRRKK